jgi:outer membrane protein OmpA-like peptidoglycan-associated protein
LLFLAAALAGCQTKPPARPVRAAATPAVQPVCADFSFPIYFETSADRLSPAALRVIQDAAARVKGCTLGRIDVVGLADAGGSDRVNMAVSRRRAASVAAALAAAGLPRPVFDIAAAGDSGAVTPAGDPEPLRRRTEVVIRASPPPVPAPVAQRP